MWKYIEGYEDYYRINENGDIESSHVKGRQKRVYPLFFKPLKTWLDFHGYRFAWLKLKKKGLKKLCKISRLVYFAFNSDADLSMIVDHIDCNRSNDSLSNLRLCSHTQNMTNQKPKTNKYKGVYFCRDKRLWRARITVNKKEIFLGYYPTEIEAALSYNKGSMRYHGEYGKLNVV